MFLQASDISLDKNPSMNSRRYVDSILKKVSRAYQPYLSSFGATLVINNDWENNSIGASARRVSNSWHIRLTGGMARHPQMTEDGYLTVACHEIGHHLGGKPKWTGPFGRKRWSSNEGQSDYYAMTKCMKLVLEGEDHRAKANLNSVPISVRLNCEDRYTGEANFLCQRLALASLSAVRVQEAREGKEFRANFDSPSSKEVQKIFDNHNSPQCRLDTLYAGVLCNKSVMPNIDGDFQEVNCLREEGYSLEVRPLCWFKPKTN